MKLYITIIYLILIINSTKSQIQNNSSRNTKLRTKSSTKVNVIEITPRPLFRNTTPLNSNLVNIEKSNYGEKISSKIQQQHQNKPQSYHYDDYYYPSSTTEIQFQKNNETKINTAPINIKSPRKNFERKSRKIIANASENEAKTSKAKESKHRKEIINEPITKSLLSNERKNSLPKKFISNTTLISILAANQPERGPTKVVLPIQKSLKRLAPPSDAIICPKETQARFNLFAPNCDSDADCWNWSKDSRCCHLFGNKNCHKGIPKPLKEPSHTPILGIARKCPARPLAELWWDLKTCETDNDCWPRVCCPDGQQRYCRTSQPEYEMVPFRIGKSLSYLSEYLECTAAPPPIFDLHPKMCKSSIDCFPNVCCQEAGKRHCRPPKKSLLTTIMTNFLNNGLIKRLTNNFAIK